MRTIKSRVFRLASLVFLSISVIFPSIASAAPGDVGAWTTSTSLPGIRSYPVSDVYNGFAYVVGGWNGSAGTTTVYYAPLNSNGTVGTWVTNGTSLPDARRVSFGFAHNGYFYVMGGLNGSDSRTSTVYYAPINGDGSIGTWATNANPLPVAIQQSMTVVRDGYVYVFGGHTTSAQSTVYYAPINGDGSIGTWASDTALPEARGDTSAVLVNDKVYIIGGRDASTSALDTVIYAGFDSDHSTGMWASTTSMPAARSDVDVEASDGYIYIVGGTITSSVNTVYSAKVKSDGTLSAWTTSPNTLITPISGNGAVTYNNFIIVFGGRNDINNTISSVSYAAVTPPTRTSTATNPVTSKPISISTGFGTDITCTNATQESSLAVADANYSYPVGLVSFCYDTDASSNVITAIFVTDLTPSQVTARHFNSTTNTYSTIPGAVITATTYNSQPALQVVYSITDNSNLDTNGTTGSVTDPVGLGVAIAAPNTGLERKNTAPIFALILTGVTLVAAGLVNRKRKAE